MTCSSTTAPVKLLTILSSVSYKNQCLLTAEIIQQLIPQTQTVTCYIYVTFLGKKLFAPHLWSIFLHHALLWRANNNDKLDYTRRPKSPVLLGSVVRQGAHVTLYDRIKQDESLLLPHRALAPTSHYCQPASSSSPSLPACPALVTRPATSSLNYISKLIKLFPTASDPQSKASWIGSKDRLSAVYVCAAR